MNTDDNKLALRVHEAAEALGLSLRHLWQLTKDKKIPHLKVGRAVLYPVDSLRRWLDEQASAGQFAGEGGAA